MPSTPRRADNHTQGCDPVFPFINNIVFKYFSYSTALRENRGGFKKEKMVNLKNNNY
jgi:hypothetical protein